MDLVQSNGRNGSKRFTKTWRFVLLAVPPVEELYLVAPLQVFGTANRLLGAGRALYAVQVASNSKSGKIEGECGLSGIFIAHACKTIYENQTDVPVLCGTSDRR
jgi:hypothetical protein